MGNSSYCLLPWVSAAIRNNGQYRVCCHANTSASQGLLRGPEGEPLHAARQGIAEARNSSTLKKIRRDMLEGRWPETCTRCAREEDAGIRSKRIYSAELHPPELDLGWARNVTRDDGSIDTTEVPLLDLDIRFGNKCNLACRMCGPTDSSLWKKDFEALGGRASTESFDWYESAPFWDSLRIDGERLRHIYIVGGEPLLIDRHYTFLEDLVERGLAGGITLEYNTNLTFLPDKALRLWTRFREVRVGVSCDGVGVFHDYIRYPGRFGALEENLRRLDTAGGRIEAWIAYSVSVYNLHHLVDAMRWVQQAGFQRIARSPGRELLVTHPVHKPEHLNIQALEPLAKRHCEVRLRTDLAAFQAEAPEHARRASAIVEKFLRFMKARDQSAQWPKFQDYTRRLDALRGQSVLTLRPPFTV